MPRPTKPLPPTPGEGKAERAPEKQEKMEKQTKSDKERSKTASERSSFTIPHSRAINIQAVDYLFRAIDAGDSTPESPKHESRDAASPKAEAPASPNSTSPPHLSLPLPTQASYSRARAVTSADATLIRNISAPIPESNKSNGASRGPSSLPSSPSLISLDGAHGRGHSMFRKLHRFFLLVFDFCRESIRLWPATRCKLRIVEDRAEAELLQRAYKERRADKHRLLCATAKPS
jgi:hypothetical protein